MRGLRCDEVGHRFGLRQAAASAAESNSPSTNGDACVEISAVGSPV
jgi:hypothetical protein